MNNIHALMKGILNIITIIEDCICVIGIWLTTILTFFAIVNRYFLRLPIMWLNDLALYCFIFFMLIAAALTSREGEHTSVGIFREKFFKGKPKFNFFHSIIIDIISIIVVLIFLHVTWQFMLQAIKYPQYGTLVRWFNASWLISTLFFTIILILIHSLTSLVINIGKFREIYTKDKGA